MLRGKYSSSKPGDTTSSSGPFLHSDLFPPAPPSSDSSLIWSVLKFGLTLFFLPAIVGYRCTKYCVKLPIRQANWVIEWVHPNYMEDIAYKKNQLKSKLKHTADASLFTMSSLVFK